MKMKKSSVSRVSAMLIFLLCLTGLSGCGGSGGSDIIAVTHPDFELKDGFILKVDQQKKAPDGYIAISDGAEFDRIRYNPSANYILMDDIDISIYTWEPIDDFSGILDGNGYVVSGVAEALFDEVEGGKIKNLGVQGEVRNSKAAIVEELDEGSLDNCYFEGSVYNDSTAAALVGSSYDGYITNCYNMGDVTGTGCASGIVAGTFGDYYLIHNCFNAGNIQNIGIHPGSQSGYSAGILARSERASGMIRHCYNVGTISCEDFNNYPVYSDYGDAIACGILSYANVPNGESLAIDMCYNGGTIEGGDLAFGIALAWGTSASRTQVTNCYNYGEFTHPNSYGIAGCATGTGSRGDVAIAYCYNASTTGEAAISNNSTSLYECYYLDAVPNATANNAMFANVYALNEKEMKKEKNFNFDFDQVWTMGNGEYEYPMFGYKNFEVTDAIA